LACFAIEKTANLGTQKKRFDGHTPFQKIDRCRIVGVDIVCMASLLSEGQHIYSTSFLS
jgi:hypothetical protein